MFDATTATESVTSDLTGSATPGENPGPVQMA